MPGSSGSGWFTVWQAVVSTVLTFLVAAPLTWAVSTYEFRGRRLTMALVTIPFVLPTVVVGTAFVALGWRDSIGAILAAHVFFNVAVVVRTVSTLWSRIDPRLLESARVLGASPARVMRRITLPLLRPALAAAASIVFLFTFTSFGVVLILGGFEYATLEVEIYRQAVTLFDLPLAATLAVVQLIGVTGSLYWYSRYQERTATTWTLDHGSTAAVPAESRSIRGGCRRLGDPGRTGDTLGRAGRPLSRRRSLPIPGRRRPRRGHTAGLGRQQPRVRGDRHVAGHRGRPPLRHPDHRPPRAVCPAGSTSPSCSLWAPRRSPSVSASSWLSMPLSTSGPPSG